MHNPFKAKIETLDDKKDLYHNIVYFFFVVVGVFGITFLGLILIGWAPKSFQLGDPLEDLDSVEAYWLGEYEVYDTGSVAQYSQSKPDRVVIDKIGVDTAVGQPETRDVAVLDKYLTNGAVYYPGSGTVEQGNMFIFGHSTGLRVVQNQAYKTFNNLNKLERGDEILVEADGGKYIYSVRTVKLLDEDSAVVTFDNSKRTLTISTCNTFGAKQERWVVEADFEREL